MNTDSFFALKTMTTYQSRNAVSIIGVPTNSSGTFDGVARAPEAYRRAGLKARLANHAHVFDLGDVNFAPPTPDRDPVSGLVAPQTFLEMVAAVDRAVGQTLIQKRFPLVIGGDCGLLIGCLNAVRRWVGSGSPALLFIDGHEDAYPPHRSPTGESADMELGLMLGRSTDGLPDALVTMLPLITSDDVAMLGIRDTEVLRQEGIASLRDRTSILMFDDQAIMQGNALSITCDALMQIGADKRRWWLHTDLDVLSTEAFPAVDYQQTGGLDWEALTAITTLALSSENVIGWDITIYNPDLDSDGEGIQRVITYIEAGIQAYVNGGKSYE